MDDSPRSAPAQDTGSDAESAARQGHLAELRVEVERGLEDIKAGRVIDLDQAFERIEAMLDELEAAKRTDT